MTKRKPMRLYGRLGFLGLVCLSAQACFAQGGVADRVVQAVDVSRTVELTGNVHPLARPEFDQGAVNGATVLPRITVFFHLSASQQASLDLLLASQQDRTSTNFHRWLTPEQFGEQFGLSATDLAKVTAWLESQGFTAIETARSRNWVAFSGTAQQVSAGLGTRIHRYAVRGETHYANASEPFVPAALADVVMGFRGLDDFRLHARATAKAIVEPKFTSAISGNHFVSPGDFATIYDLNPLYNNHIDGTGEKIAVMGQTDISLTDVRAFRAAASLPAKDPTVVALGTEPNVSTTDLPEADLDVEWSGAVARNATIIYVTSSNGVIDSLQYAISNNVAPVISISYGGCEVIDFDASNANQVAAVAEQANAEGITIVAPAGDSGATDCDDTAPATHGLAVDFPASLPYVTGVGGTQFNEGSGTYWQSASGGQDVISSALSYIPEVVWNQSPAEGDLLATGGGASVLFGKPIWQVGAGVPLSDGKRDVPDVSFGAAPSPDGYLICSQGSCVNGFRDSKSNLDEIGGTSAGVPTFAGVVALINQQTQASGQGNVNYVLYPLATNSPSAFHDITSGSNKIACMSGTTGCPTGTATIGFVAGAGYDQTTGLGSPDVNNLVTAWTSISPTSLSQSNGGSADFQLALSPSSLSVAHGATGTAQVTVTALNGFTGTVMPSCSVGSALTGVTCAVTPGGSANVFLLTVTAPASSATHRPVEGDRFSGRLVFAAMLVLLIVWTRSRRKREETSLGYQTARLPRELAPAFALTALLLIATGCGGGGSSSGNNGSNNGSNSTTSAAGAISVTGKSGAISHMAEISITVN